ncbi:hypothetical protein HS125_08765 [bacterium]|nr:hypothetical protein [bacterium]
MRSHRLRLAAAGSGRAWMRAAGFVAFWLVPAISSAQLFVSPTIVEVKAYPGGTQSFTVNVGNSGAGDLDCKLTLSAMEVTDVGLPMEVSDASRSCRDWITVTPETFALKPKQGVRVNGRINPPKSAGGGYYAILAVHGAPQRGQTPRVPGERIRAGVEFSYRNLIVIMLTVPGPEIRAVVEAAKPRLLRDPYSDSLVLEVPVRNRGNTHIRMQGRADIRSEAGGVVEALEFTSGRGLLLPAHQRLYRSKSRIKLPDGSYLMKLSLIPEGRQAQPMETHFPFHLRNGDPSAAELTEAQKAELRAQSQGFLLSPTEAALSAPPGARRTQSVDIANLTRDPLTVRAAIMQWVRDGASQDLVETRAPAAHRSAASFLSGSLGEIELPPLGRRRVPIAVALPREASGEYYAAVCFQRAGLDASETARSRARHSLLLRVGGQGTRAPAAVLTALQVRRKPSGAFEFDLSLRNSGNAGFVPEVTFNVRDADFNVTGKLLATEKVSFIQAGGEARIVMDWNQVLDAGEYQLEAVVRYDPSLPALVARKSFSAPAVSGP